MKFDGIENYEDHLARSGDPMGAKLKMVREANKLDINRFIVSKTKLEVLDTKTALIWRRVNNNGLSWDDISKTIARINKNGLAWRLPTLEELTSIIVQGEGTFAKCFRHKRDSGTLVSAYGVAHEDALSSNVYWTSSTTRADSIIFLLELHSESFYNTRIIVRNRHRREFFNTSRFAARFVRDE